MECCDIVDNITRMNQESSSRTLFNRTGEDTKNPQERIFNSCAVNFVDNSVVCRYV